MSLAILFHFLCAQHVSDINISIIRSVRLFCWITTLVVLFLVRCMLEFRCGWIGVVSVLQDGNCASACNTDTTPNEPYRKSSTHRTKNITTNVVIQLVLQPATRIPLHPNHTITSTHIWPRTIRPIQLVLQPATRIPLQSNHTETPTHIEPRTIRPMW